MKSCSRQVNRFTMASRQQNYLNLYLAVLTMAVLYLYAHYALRFTSSGVNKTKDAQNDNLNDGIKYINGALSNKEDIEVDDAIEEADTDTDYDEEEDYDNDDEDDEDDDNDDNDDEDNDDYDRDLDDGKNVLKSDENDPVMKEQKTKDILDTTGHVFEGQKVRDFPAKLVKFRGHFLQPDFTKMVKRLEEEESLRCDKWAVLTTIFEPSEATRRFLYAKDWCMVVVGDYKKPENYRFATTQPNNLIFLTPEDQIAINSVFVDTLPWASLGRKNIGYLYAVANGAQVIWDFDDDNVIKFFLDGATDDDNLMVDYFADYINKSPLPVRIPKTSHIAYNPYPTLGAPKFPCWPRGFPLSSLHTPETYNVSYRKTKLNRSKLGVLQSLADHDPDVDAVYRMVQTVPMSFNMIENPNTVLIPKGVFTPYNAQATLHYRPAFHALYLPITVTGRVTDIWRGFFAKALFDLSDIYIGFPPRPLVYQERNVHDYNGDFIAEEDLYIKTNALLKFLSDWTEQMRTDMDTMTFEEMIEALWIDLYERTYIELEDVTNMQLWIEALSIVGYAFPKGGQNSNREKTAYVPRTKKGDMDFSVGHPISYQPEGEPGECSGLAGKPPKTFYSTNIHPGTHTETPSILTHLGQKMILGGAGKKSFYPELASRPGISQHERVSDVLKKNNAYNSLLTKEDISSNFDFYKNDPVMKEIDAFYCAYPAAQCQLWIPFKKPVFFLTVHRFHMSQCSADDWLSLQDTLETLHQSDKNAIGAGSRFDVEYMRYYTGFPDIRFVQMYSGFYTNDLTYAPDNTKDVLYFRQRQGTKYYQHYQKLVSSLTKKMKLSYVWDLYPTFQLEDLVKHRAIIFLPYAVTTYKVTEIYTLNIPLFMPSLKYFRVHGGFGMDRSLTSKHFCANGTHLIEEVQPHSSVGHPYNPNTEFAQDPEAEMYWLQLADYFEWPHVQLFDDAEDLQRKLDTVDLVQISRKMAEENKVRRHLFLKNWCEMLTNLSG